ncbi:hypothetical protein PV328_000756 [Microctonus aethiopoides]|uniref:Uncharacterized protein n=2 Tax=Microctonus aethiopoides TaxID=144406 RepID=A0AA39FVI6_9HYME|nr:hypothetical protein PV328_000756 [Microctonus aethiopoides]
MEFFDNFNSKNQVCSDERLCNDDFNDELLAIVQNPAGKLDKNILMNDSFFFGFCTKPFNGVKELILNGNELFTQIGKRLTDIDVNYLLNFLINNPDAHDHIVELNIQNNEIGPDGIAKMCENGGKLKLKILRLNGNKFGNEASKNIALMLCNNLYIEHIEVAEVDQTISSLIYFTTIMRSDQVEFNNCLKILDISRPNPAYMNDFDSSHFAYLIGSMLKTNTCLIELHLQKYSFSCHDIELMLIDGISNITLKLLDLNCNNIGDHGINSICKWLYRRPALAGLMLSHNIIKIGGARALSFALPFSRVQLLDISYNNINNSGIADILNTIKKSPCMRNLRLFGNQIGDKSAKIIRRMLASGVLVQENLDVKPYEVDNKYYVAYYPANYYKQKYYNAISQPMKIYKQNNIHNEIKSSKITFTY